MSKRPPLSRQVKKILLAMIIAGIICSSCYIAFAYTRNYIIWGLGMASNIAILLLMVSLFQRQLFEHQKKEEQASQREENQPTSSM